MNTTPDLTEVRTILAAALDERRVAKPRKSEDNPLAKHTVRELAQGKGVRVWADQLPALSMAAKTDGSPTNVAVEIEQARRAGLTDGHNDKSARRMAAQRARVARKNQIDALANAPVIPDKDRLAQAWAIVLPMTEVVTKIAQSKKAWATRFLGSVADDIASIALEQMVLVLAKDDRDLTVLRQAAEELGGLVRRTGQLPGDQVVDDAARKERRQLSKARKWLMGMANNRVMGALVDTYTNQRNLRWENIDLIATVMASISGVGDDPMSANFKANRVPAMLGSRFQRPGSFDPNWLAQAITAAITEHRLDRLVELMLDDDRRQTSGAFKWDDNAEAVFLATPDDGAWRWELVRKATAHLADPRHARGQAARLHVRNTFDWLPALIVAIVEAFDYQVIEHIEYVDGHLQAIMGSRFEQLQDRTGKRKPLRPAPTFATATEAAAALTQYLAVLVTGEDYTLSIAHA
jgi:hypothetical protein